MSFFRTYIYLFLLFALQLFNFFVQLFLSLLPPSPSPPLRDLIWLSSFCYFSIWFRFFILLDLFLGLFFFGNSIKLNFYSIWTFSSSFISLFFIQVLMLIVIPSRSYMLNWRTQYIQTRYVLWEGWG